MSRLGPILTEFQRRLREFHRAKLSQWTPMLTKYFAPASRYRRARALGSKRSASHILPWWPRRVGEFHRSKLSQWTPMLTKSFAPASRYRRARALGSKRSAFH